MRLLSLFLISLVSSIPMIASETYFCTADYSNTPTSTGEPNSLHVSSGPSSKGAFCGGDLFSPGGTTQWMAYGLQFGNPPFYTEAQTEISYYSDDGLLTPDTYDVTISAVQTFKTAGAPRSGFADLRLGGFLEPYTSGVAEAAFSDGTHSYFVNRSTEDMQVPVTLGVPFTLQTFFHFAGEIGPGIGLPGVDGAVNFLESDGTTPVYLVDLPASVGQVPTAISGVPEPASLALTSLAGLLFACARLRRRP